MSRRRMLSLSVVLGLLVTAWSALAATMFFKWIDAKGNLHVTDRLADVPEPYYAMYRAKVREIEEREAKQGIAVPETTSAPVERIEAVRPSAPSIVDLELQRQKDWRALVANWRGELTAATAEVESLQNELDDATLNPILRETPQAKDQIAEIADRHAVAMRRLEAARQMLLVDLPARARKDGVPPKWLE